MGKQLDIYKRFKAYNSDKYYLFKYGFSVKPLEKYLYLFNKENIMIIEVDVISEKIVIDVWLINKK